MTVVTHYNTAEGYAVGATVTAGTSGGASGDPFQATVTDGGGTVSVVSPGVHGDRAYRLRAGAGQVAGVVYSGLGARALAHRAYLTLPGPATALTQIVVHRGQDDVAVGRIFLAPDGRVGVQNARANVTQYLPGTPVYPLTMRVELVTDLDAQTVTGAWAVGDGDLEGQYAITGTNLGTSLIGAAHVGKLNATTWDADIRLDDVAVNTRATGLIGPYAETYTRPPDPGPDRTVHPLRVITLTGEGDGEWAQNPTDPVQAEMSATGATLRLRPPATFTGTVLHLTYGGMPVEVTVLPVTEGRKRPDGTWEPVVRVLLERRADYLLTQPALLPSPALVPSLNLYPTPETTPVQPSGVFTAAFAQTF